MEQLTNEEIERTKMNALSWINSINSRDSVIYTADSVFHHSPAGKNNALILGPCNASPTAKYMQAAQSKNMSKSPPTTIYDGLQTTVNMCRVKSEYDPLDQEGKGTNKYFLLFTNQISAVPFLTLEWAQTTNIKQKSHNADEIINSFVDGFRGIFAKDKQDIRTSVKKLVKAALSYSSTRQKESNFVQNILDVDDKGKVHFNLYASTFEILQTQNKGTITYKAEYSLSQASYSMSPSIWEVVRELLNQQHKQSIEDWINNMTTQPKEGSKANLLCFD